MKGVFALLCCVAVALAKPRSSSNDASSACAGEDSESLIFAHENCNRFNQCNGGVPVTLDCPAGLVFNIISQLCDWPENVNCAGRPIVEGNGANNSNKNGNDSGNGEDNDSSNGDNGAWQPENGYDDPSQAPAICAAEGSDGVLIAHEVCSQFYKCLKGTPVALGCPLSLKYNPKLESCDWPQNVDCTGRNDSENGDGNDSGNGDDNDSGNGDNNGNGNDNGAWEPENGYDDPSQAPAICAAEGSDGALIAHEICSQFYKCLEGKPVALGCPLSLKYNPKLEACDWPQNVDCAGRN